MNSETRGTRDPLLFALVCIISVLFLTGLVASLIWALMPKYPVPPHVGPTPDTEDTSGTGDTSGGDEPVIADTTTLALSPDAGQAYLDSIVFFGESTTTHWRQRGGLSGGVNTEQVWVPAEGTFTLNEKTASTLLVATTQNGSYMTLAELAALKKPAVMVLTVGINGVTTFCKSDRSLDYYESWYQKIIDAIRVASPETRIIIQSSFPISSTSEGYLDVQKVIHEYIPALNRRAYELAKKNGLKYLNTAEILDDGTGELAVIYNNGDGVHLTADAYAAMRDYIRTHAWVD